MLETEDVEPISQDGDKIKSFEGPQQFQQDENELPVLQEFDDKKDPVDLVDQ